MLTCWSFFKYWIIKVQLFGWKKHFSALIHSGIGLYEESLSPFQNSKVNTKLCYKNSLSVWDCLLVLGLQNGQWNFHRSDKLLKDASFSNWSKSEGVLFTIIMIYDAIGYWKMSKLHLECVHCIANKIHSHITFYSPESFLLSCDTTAVIALIHQQTEHKALEPGSKSIILHALLVWHIRTAGVMGEK